MVKSRKMKLEEFFSRTFSDEFLHEAEACYKLAQANGRAFDAEKQSNYDIDKMTKDELRKRRNDLLYDIHALVNKIRILQDENE